MQRYIIIRLAQTIFVILAISIIVFGLSLASGNPVDLMLPVDARLQDREGLTQAWGLDKPYHVQYWKFISNALRGDLGESVNKWPGRSAISLIGNRFVATLELTLAALALAAIVGVILGVITASMRDSPFDYIFKIFALLGQSAPSFWIGIMLVWIFAVEINWFPTSGKGGIEHIVLPAITLGWFQVAAIMRLVRSSMLDTLNSEYVMLARIKGLNEWKVIWKHCLRNAAIAPLTYFGILAGSLITGSVVVETVFSWPGLGLLVFEAVIVRDFQVVRAVVIVVAVAFVMLNLMVDILYAYLDPRIRYG